MALNTFGGTPADVVTDATGNVVALDTGGDPIELTVYTSAARTTQVTALFAMDGTTPLPGYVTPVNDPGGPNHGRLRFKASDAYPALWLWDGNPGSDSWLIWSREAPSQLNDVGNQLGGKADQTDLDATDVTVAGKADQSAYGFNVREYGATGNGVTDDTAAILAAQTAAGTRPLYFPNGTYLFSTGLTAQTILGENRQKTILSYTGTGNAISVPIPVVQSYHRRLENFTLRGTGSATTSSGGGTGLHLDSVSAGMFLNLYIEQFSQAVWMRSSVGPPQQCLYNTFIDCTFSDSYYGVRLDDVSNENRFIACRVNGATRGFHFVSGNSNIIESCAIENCSERGVSLPDTTPGSNLTRGTVLSFNRFEFNTNNITIFSGVQRTMVLANNFVGGTYIDNGTGTVLIDRNTGAVAAGRYATGSRPSAPITGAQIYDTTLGRPIWWNGSVWKDAAGTTV